LDSGDSSAATTEAIVLESVTKRCEDVIAVNDVSFEIREASSSPCSARRAAARRRRCA
jgi:hypothetical protein